MSLLSIETVLEILEKPVPGAVARATRRRLAHKLRDGRYTYASEVFRESANRQRADIFGCRAVRNRS